VVSTLISTYGPSLILLKSAENKPASDLLPREEAGLKALRVSAMRGRPFGSSRWSEETAKRMGLQASLRDPGRRRKLPNADEAKPF
jgi:hypothetical protein